VVPERATGWIVVFAKHPLPGSVKTRLVPPFTREEAALFYDAMLGDVLELTARAAAALGLEPILAVDPPDARRSMASRAPASFRVIAQRGSDLGQRMAHAVDEAAAAGATPILLRGSDSPALGEETLAAALAALQDSDLVVCPDRDGGYNLIGLRRPAPGLFRHPMSTASVLTDTLANAAFAGLQPARERSIFSTPEACGDMRTRPRVRHRCAVDPTAPEAGARFREGGDCSRGEHGCLRSGAPMLLSDRKQGRTRPG
jgi:rSAM/selenodomain-associated transferase 1